LLLARSEGIGTDVGKTLLDFLVGPFHEEALLAGRLTSQHPTFGLLHDVGDKRLARLGVVQRHDDAGMTGNELADHRKGNAALQRIRGDQRDAQSTSGWSGPPSIRMMGISVTTPVLSRYTLARTVVWFMRHPFATLSGAMASTRLLAIHDGKLAKFSSLRCWPLAMGGPS
jgi:hypothetical protein